MLSHHYVTTINTSGHACKHYATHSSASTPRRGIHVLLMSAGGQQHPQAISGSAAAATDSNAGTGSCACCCCCTWCSAYSSFCGCCHYCTAFGFHVGQHTTKERKRCWTYSHHCQIADKNPSKRWNAEFRGFLICIGWISTTGF